ncbi:arginine--tRNA ligase [Candidatus Phytoplasma ziziphi]|uniref:Arginine--tRNA ligase n=2 Tax=Candidatus Phytoplasma TaxID=33926 RepID=A0A660HLN3_ZIZJU|nr:arginine--tRNA ligase [Candidatus Phytoplasma ziziphi]AYJ00967.1 arginine--tRNA ligase [Candidatus Phytoplasma ziziphi]
MYLKKIKTKIEKILNDKYVCSIFLQNNLNEDKFDFFIPLFSYVKILKKNLLEIFEVFKKDLIELEQIENVFFQNGFLNIKLNRKKITQNILLNILNSDESYCQKEFNNQIVVLDYSSPNIAKNFSIGHLRSTVIGNALKKVYQKLGFKTVSINHLGDWGTQFGKLIVAYQKWAKKENMLKDPINELQRVYILFHQEEIKNPQLDEQARQIFYLLENKDKEINELWKYFKEISLNEFHQIYDLLGVSFDYYIGESFFHDKAIQLLEELKNKKILVLDDEAYVIPLENDLSPALIQKKNGSTLYLTRDIACVLYRYQKFNFSKCLYVVGNEQKLHYQQLKLVINKIGYENLQLEHVNFGLILFQNMKISTRENNNFRLKDIIYKAEIEVKNIIKDRNFFPEKINEISRQISIGAIIFNDLKNDRHLDIEFDLEKMLKFEGNTGPYLQYTVVRLNSIIQKQDFNINELTKNDLNPYYEKFHYYVLIRLMDQFDSVLEKVQESNMPSILARYLFQLAKNANKFYEKEKILNNNDLKLQYANILLIKSLLIILKEGLKILGVPILEKM